MNILVTGAKGYIARNLVRLLPKYNFTKIDHTSLDITDQKSVDAFFANQYFDAVIHTAVSGGKRTQKDDSSCLYDNLLMHNNLMKNKQHFGRIISFGSGAEFDRTTNISDSSSLEESLPNDPYGLSKNIIAKTSLNESKFYNIRIFNVFNYDELETRMIKSNIIKYINKEPMKIHQNKIMDFFFMDDLSKIVELVIEQQISDKTVNCCYEYHHSLLEIAQYINNLSDYKVSIDIENETLGTSYYGQYNIPEQVGLKGLLFGIKDSYDKILEEYK